MSTKACKLCRAYKPESGSPGSGECRSSPPVSYVPLFGDQGPYWAFPLVDGDDWCDNFKPAVKMGGPLRTHCRRGHELTEDNLVLRTRARRIERQCRICTKLRGTKSDEP